jgi:hypothetical protein
VAGCNRHREEVGAGCNRHREEAAAGCNRHPEEAGAAGSFPAEAGVADWSWLALLWWL